MYVDQVSWKSCGLESLSFDEAPQHKVVTMVRSGQCQAMKVAATEVP